MVSVGLTKPSAKAIPFMVIALAISSVIVIGATEQSFSPLLTSTLTTALAISAVAVRFLFGSFDRTDSILWGNAALGVMFGVHPFAMIVTGVVNQPFYYIYNLNPGYGLATQLGFLATIAFNIGYFTDLKMNKIPAQIQLESPRKPVITASPKLARRFAWFLIVLAFAAFSLFAVQVGSNVFTAIAEGARRGDNTNSSAYLYFAPQLVGPAALLFLYADLVEKKKPITAVVLAVIQTAIFLPGGQRLVLLLALVPIPVAYFLIRKVRLKTWTTALIALLAFLTIVSLRDLGAPDGPKDPVTAFMLSFQEPEVKITQLLTGADTEMIDSLSLEVQVVPSQIDHAPGSLLVNVFTAPVPSVFWPDKPAPMDVVLNQYILNVARNNASIAYSFVGELFYDGGRIGVVGGFFLLGFVSSRMNTAKLLTVNPAFMLVYAAFLPTLVSLMRGSLVYTFGRGLFTIFPVIVFWFLSRRETEKSVHSRAGSPIGKVTSG